MALLPQRRITVQLMRIEDRAHIAERVSGNRRDLRLGAAGQRETGDGRAAKIVEGHASDACGLLCLAHDDRNPSSVQGWSPLLTRMSGDTRTVVSSDIGLRE